MLAAPGTSPKQHTPGRTPRPHLPAFQEWSRCSTNFFASARRDPFGVPVNLEGLDGVTIAFDYPKALAELDRGYETTFVLKPSSEFAQGVAMAPAVKRDGVIKTHIAFDGNVFIHFMNTEDEYWDWMHYQLAH